VEYFSKAGKLFDNLVKSFMNVELVPIILHLIEEVPDFKGYVEGVLPRGMRH
jgi:hypothetical protein